MKPCPECGSGGSHHVDCPVLHGLMRRKRSCPDCGGNLRPIRLYMGYSELDTRKSWVNGAYTDSGAVYATRCEACDGVRWFALPNDAARSTSGFPIPAGGATQDELPIPSSGDSEAR
jgi:hypothetical protein